MTFKLLCASLLKVYNVCLLLIFIADLSLGEIRRLYFKLKSDVFMKKIGGILLPDSQTEILENILKSTVGEYTTLGSKTHPKYRYHF